MSNIVNVTAKLDDKVLISKINSLLDQETLLEIHNLLAKYCDPYVPFLEGPLSQSTEITPDYVRYTQPYAHYQYYGVGFNHTKDYHPLASAKWDEAMLRDKREEFLEEVKQILIRRAAQIYGG